jgi:2,5-diketo-D-gluconate reductase B
MQRIVNAHGLNMPKLGLGTWPMLGEECTRAVEHALTLGYRHIDTAAAYNNEDAVGQALVNSPTPREQIHVAGLSKRERQVNPDFAPVWDAFDQ